MRYELLAELKRDLSDAYDRRIIAVNSELQEQFLGIARAVVDRRFNHGRVALSEMRVIALPASDVLTTSARNPAVSRGALFQTHRRQIHSATHPKQALNRAVKRLSLRILLYLQITTWLVH
jgi:hypothetical protein